MTTIKINQFNRAAHNAFQNACEKALQAVADEFGVTIRQHGGQLGTSEAIFKFKAMIPAAAQPGAQPGAPVQSQTLLSYCKMLGIDPAATLAIQGRTHRLIDYNTRAHRTPFITEGKTQWGEPKRYRWSTDAVKRQFKSPVTNASAAQNSAIDRMVAETKPNHPAHNYEGDF